MDKGQIVIVGHCCLDKAINEYRLGGSVSYINAIFNSRNIAPVLITAFGKDFPFTSILEQSGSKVIVQESQNTTIFHNIYTDTGRKQFLLKKANNIKWQSEYKELEPVDILLLCPIADEVDYGFITKLEAKLKVATIQGWLRKQNADLSIGAKCMDSYLLKGLDIVIFSVEDLPEYQEIMNELVILVPIVVVTNGKYGAEVFTKKVKYFFPSFAVIETDPTGAGDSFACGLASKYFETRNLQEAVIYGHAIASLVVENKGIYFPTEPEIALRVERYPEDKIIHFQ